MAVGPVSEDEGDTAAPGAEVPPPTRRAPAGGGTSAFGNRHCRPQMDTAPPDSDSDASEYGRHVETRVRPPPHTQTGTRGDRRARD